MRTSTLKQLFDEYAKLLEDDKEEKEETYSTPREHWEAEAIKFLTWYTARCCVETEASAHSNFARSV